MLILSLAVALSVDDWSRTAHGKLPSKTAVILHAVNNNLVPVDIDVAIPEFLTPTSKGNTGVEMVKKDMFISSSANNNKLPVRIYHYSNTENAPVLIYLHGGAFMEGYGNVDTHDNIIRTLAARTGAVVISPSYRLAPDHIFPSAVNDSYQTLVWAFENAEKFGGDPDKIAIAGDSAGGNLATVTALKSRNENGPELFAQILYYPLTTFQDTPFESRATFDSGYYFLSRQVMMEARETYTPEASMWKHPYTSPLEAESLDDLPPALIITAQFDPLRDEGELYGEKLHEAGVPVQTVRYNGVMHGFISLYQIMKSGDSALQDSVRFLKETEHNKVSVQEEYELTVKHAPSGWDRVKEEAEAFVIAAFLVGKSTFHYVGDM